MFKNKMNNIPKIVFNACKFCVNFQPGADRILDIKYYEDEEIYLVHMRHDQERNWGTYVGLEEHFVRSAVKHLNSGGLNKWTEDYEYYEKEKEFKK